MRSRISTGIYEFVVIAGGVTVDSVTSITPLWIWPTIVVLGVIGLVVINWGAIKAYLVVIARRVRRKPASPLAAVESPVDVTRMKEAQRRAIQADSDFRTFWYDLNTAIARYFTPAAYRSDKPNKDKKSEDDTDTAD